MGVKIVGIIDRNGGLMKKEGFSLDEVKKLFADKQGNQLIANNLMPFEQLNQQIWKVGAEIFIPGAASRLVTKSQIERLIDNDLEVISCGANVPFIDDEVFFGNTAKFADSKISVIPDFIANCGMARVFAYLMQKDAELTDRGIFFDVSQTIENAIKKIHAQNPSFCDISNTALTAALSKVLS